MRENQRKSKSIVGFLLLWTIVGAACLYYFNDQRSSVQDVSKLGVEDYVNYQDYGDNYLTLVYGRKTIERVPYCDMIPHNEQYPKTIAYMRDYFNFTASLQVLDPSVYKGKFKESIYAFAKGDINKAYAVITNEPKHSGASCIWKAQLHLLRGEDRKADQLFRKTLESQPNYINHIHYSRYLLLKDRKEEAKHHLNIADDLYHPHVNKLTTPQSAVIAYHLAELSSRLDLPILAKLYYQYAITKYQHLAESDKENTFLHLETKCLASTKLGDYYMRHNENKKAIAAYKESIQLLTSFEQNYDYAGAVKDTVINNEINFSKWANHDDNYFINPYLIDVYTHLGDICFTQGALKKANKYYVQAYLRYKKLDPVAGHFPEYTDRITALCKTIASTYEELGNLRLADRYNQYSELYSLSKNS